MNGIRWCGFESHFCAFDFLLFYEYVIFIFYECFIFVQYIAVESFFCLFIIPPQTTVFVAWGRGGGGSGGIYCFHVVVRPSVRLSVRDVLVFP